MLRVGMLTDTSSKQQVLSQLITHAGHHVGCQLHLKDGVDEADFYTNDAWLIDVDQDYCDLGHLVEAIIAQDHRPVIVSDSSDYRIGSDEHGEWKRRTRLRLERLRGDINLEYVAPAQRVWVLAASTGGPAAVKRFLQALPPNLGIALLYVQHIDAGQTESLQKMMQNASAYGCQMGNQGAVLAPNTLTLIDPATVTDLIPNGTLSCHEDTHWKGDYAPCIDQVTINAANIYRQRCGVIIFSGMGDDGATGCKIVHQVGGRVFIQTPTDCTSDAMPQAALTTNCVDFVGLPEELAQHLVSCLAPERSLSSPTPLACAIG